VCPASLALATMEHDVSSSCARDCASEDTCHVDGAEYRRTRDECAKLREETEREVQEMRQEFEAEVAAFQSTLANHQASYAEKVKLDVGGVRYTTTRTTLCRVAGSYLALMFSGAFELETDASDGTVFIDRDGILFRHILNFLRDPVNFSLCRVNLTSRELALLAMEADFYLLREELFKYYRMDQHAASILGSLREGRAEETMWRGTLVQTYGPNTQVNEEEVALWMRNMAFRVQSELIGGAVFGTFVMTKALSPATEDLMPVSRLTFHGPNLVSPVWESDDGEEGTRCLRLYKRDASSFVIADANVGTVRGHTRITEHRRLYAIASLKNAGALATSQPKGEQTPCPLRLFFSGQGDQLQWLCSVDVLERRGLLGGKNSEQHADMIALDSPFALCLTHSYEHGPVGAFL